MSYEEFVDLKKGQSVEDRNGLLGNVTSIDILAGDVWVLWENEKETLWSSYKEVEIY